MVEIGKAYRFDYPREFTTLPDYTAHRGQAVTVLRELTPAENQTEFPMFRVLAGDGWEGDAWEDELASS